MMSSPCPALCHGQLNVKMLFINHRSLQCVLYEGLHGLFQSSDTLNFACIKLIVVVPVCALLYSLCMKCDTWNRLEGKTLKASYVDIFWYL